MTDERVTDRGSAATPPAGRVRRGGRFVADGRRTTWTVSDGSRGRRWRGVSTSPSGTLAWALETAPGGGFLKLEAEAADALLSLHVERDGELHGHVVRARGIDHVALGMVDPPLVLLEGEILSAAALIRAAAGVRGAVRGEAPAGGSGGADGMEAGRGRVVLVRRDLRVEVVALSVGRIATDEWTVGAAELALTLRVDPDGLPVVAGGASWPLER